MKNCQFKTLRENTLKSDKLKETHARQLQLNPFGGPSGLKNIKYEQVKSLPSLTNLAPQRVMEKIVEAEESGSPGKKHKVESKIAKKEEVKEATKRLFHSKVSCDLQRTYNPPNPIQQPSVMD